MKILVITQIFPSRFEPSHGPFNVNVYSSLQKHGEVRVLSPRTWWKRMRRPGDMISIPREVHSGLIVDYPTYWSLPRRIELHGDNLYRSLRAVVADVHRQFPFDCIVAAWAYPDAYAAVRLAGDYGCPVITNVLGSDINALSILPSLSSQIKRTLTGSDAIVAVSSALRESVVRLGVDASKVFVVHNGVDGERFAIRDRTGTRSALGLPAGRKITLWVGRLSHEKGADIALNALSHIMSCGRTDIDLVIVGYGKEEVALRSLAERLNISRNVSFVGRKSHEQIAQYLAAADVFCLSSRQEGCPNVVLEALASGRPVVATRVGGVGELLNDCNGVIANPEDPIDLANGIVNALGRAWDPDVLRNSVTSLSWQDVGDRYFEVISSAVSARSGGPNTQPTVNPLTK